MGSFLRVMALILAAKPVPEDWPVAIPQVYAI
jgi:hypothetical protein